MTPEVIGNNPADLTSAPPSTAGITSKVVKGSIWTLGGQVLPLFASLVTVPLIIRSLGSEGYGLLILVGLIPTYFSFSELGMGMASTRFASERYAEGDLAGEATAIRTAALIAFVSSSIIAVGIVLFAQTIIGQFNVPNELRQQAVIGLRLSAVTYVTTILCGVVNTAQLTRLRMDLNAAINGVSKVVSSLGTVVVLYLGGRIIGVTAWLLTIGVVNLAAHILVSGSLLRQFMDLSIDRRLIRPLIRFGSGLAMSAIAAMLLINLEKLLVGKFVSVESLAFYSVAFTFANMATMLSSSMVQSLVPAFSQLLAPDKKQQFSDLFARVFRLCVICLLPMLMFMFVVAKPFFTFWAGPDFGRESTGPFYLLLVGLLFNIAVYIPWASVIAFGRTDLIAKIHWAELVPYAVIAALLIKYFGITGAAAAWSLRAVVDAFVFTGFSHRVTGVRGGLARTLLSAVVGVAVLAPPILITVYYGNASLFLFAAVPVCIALYAVVVWMVFIAPGERAWLISRGAYFWNKQSKIA